MILQDLFEGRMKDLDIEYQDFLNSRGRGAMTDKMFQQAYGMTRTEWAKKNKEWTQQKERRPVAPDAHLFHEEQAVEEEQIDEKQDACYHKVKSRYKVWPSAYASGALVQCRKKGAANWGNKTKK